MKYGSILIFALFVALAAPGLCQQTENNQAVLRLTSLAAGSFMESSVATQSTSLGDLSSPGQSIATIASLFVGFLIPALDSGGLITTARIVDYLLSRNLTLDPLAADFFGNQDGKLDVADAVRHVNRQP